MQALVRASLTGELGASVRVVVSNTATAPGVTWAREAGIETVVISHRDYANRDAYDRALVDALKARGVQWVCLAGFMRVLGPRFCEAFPGSVLNIHPSLLPAFPGVDAQGQAYVHGVKVTGVTVHFVTPELDAGPIVAQIPVPIEDGDSVETLRARLLTVEHRIYAEALRRLLTDTWRIEGRTVVFGGM